jgi:hypothetical protein
MKHLLLSILVLFSLSVSAQVYDPSKHIPVNKGLGVAQAAPTDARSMFYDANNFVYRPYQSTAEVLTYLSLAKYRVGGFDIIVNSGGTLANGVITGGTNSIYYFKDGTADGDLTLKGATASLSNLGSGFKIGVAGTTNIKTVFAGYGITVDSVTNTNGVTVKIDSATLFDDMPSSAQDTVFLSVKSFGAAGDGVTDDAGAIQDAVDWIESHPNGGEYVVFFPPGRYITSSSIQLPYYISNSTPNVRILFLGYGATLKTTSAIAIFERLPLTQTGAVDSLISRWVPSFKGITFEGSALSGQVGVRIGATYSMAFEECNFTSLDTGIVNLFGLQTIYRNIRMTNNVKENFWIDYGRRWGGTKANSQSNSNSIYDSRVYGASGASSHVTVFGCNGPYILNFISEGNKPRHNFVLDSDSSTNVKFAHVENVHVEATGGSFSSNTVFKIVAGGNFTFKTIYLQYPDTLFNVAGSLGGSKIIFDNIPYIGALPSGVAFNAGGATTLGYDLIFKNISAGPTFYTKLTDAASWSGGSLPFELFLEYELASGSATKGYYAYGGHRFIMKNSNFVTFDGGGLIWDTDNTYDIGGRVGLYNYRPRDVFVGRNMYVSNSGRYYFGDATTTSDVSVARGASGRMDIMDNGSGWADLKMKTLTLTAQLNAINLSGSSIVPDSSLYRNPSTGDVVSVKLPVYSTVILASDQTNNNAVALTWEDVTGLQFPVESGKTYVFRFYVTYDCGSTTTGSKWAINGPTLTSTSYRQGAARSITNVFWNVNNDYDQGSNSGETAFLTGNFVTVEGIIRCSASGNVVLRHASETSGVAVTAKAGLSFVEYRKID